MSSLTKTLDTCQVVVLVSGNGSNLQAILDTCQDRHSGFNVVAVISNEANAYALIRAKRAGVATHVVSHRHYASRDDFDAALHETIERYTPDLVVLAGFMRILGKRLVTAYADRIMNIHPSLLPAYPGLNTHARAIADGAVEHGASVHFVTAELDAGPVIIQARVDISPGDTPDQLARRVHLVEHEIYPRAIQWFAEGRLSSNDNPNKLSQMTN